MAVDRRIEGYAEALFDVAHAEGLLDVVENELYQVARTVESSDELRTVLADAAIPVDRRTQIVDDLLGGKGAANVTRSLVSFVVAAGRGRDLPAIVDEFVQKAATERQHEVAEVRSAIPLDGEQQQRLAAALSNATGKQVEVKVTVDPTVLGGLVARMGDRVIDGTVATRLQQLRNSL
jgi:F-type H+-transporting ATPase subunit delta